MYRQLLLLGFLVSHVRCDSYVDPEAYEDFQNVFNLSTALDYLKRHNSRFSNALLYTFHTYCGALVKRPPPKFRKPFIVIEGNHRRSRNVISGALSRQMRGRYLVHPAHCLREFSDRMPTGSVMRRAFYTLSHYALAARVRYHLAFNRTVILNGYYWDSVVYNTIQGHQMGNVPEATDDIYKFPRDLLKPDVVFFLHFPDNLFDYDFKHRSPDHWKPRVLNKYIELHKIEKRIIIVNLRRRAAQSISVIYKKLNKTELPTYCDIESGFKRFQYSQIKGAAGRLDGLSPGQIEYTDDEEEFN